MPVIGIAVYRSPDAGVTWDAPILLRRSAGRRQAVVSRRRQRDEPILWKCLRRVGRRLETRVRSHEQSRRNVDGRRLTPCRHAARTGFVLARDRGRRRWHGIHRGFIAAICHLLKKRECQSAAGGAERVKMKCARHGAENLENREEVVSEPGETIRRENRYRSTYRCPSLRVLGQEVYVRLNARPSTGRECA